LIRNRPRPETPAHIVKSDGADGDKSDMKMRKRDCARGARVKWTGHSQGDRTQRDSLAIASCYATLRNMSAPSCNDICRLDEVVISINGEERYLWRAVDQQGYVLDEIVQVQLDTKAARRLLMRLLCKQGRLPKRVIADKPGSYAAAKRKIMPKIEHRSHKGLDNRAENFHVPIRKRERMMQGFRSWPGLQRFVSTFSAVPSHFAPSLPALGLINPPSSSKAIAE
jgi:putative transposase